MSLKSGGYCEPGVETKLSAKLSTGECSYLMCGVVAIAIEVSGGLGSLGVCGCVRGCAFSSISDFMAERVNSLLGNVEVPSIEVCTGLVHIDNDTFD